MGRVFWDVRLRQVGQNGYKSMKRDIKLGLSVIVPVYNSEKILPQLMEQLRNVMAGITREYEIILVDDGSPDGSWAEIERSYAMVPEVIGLKLSRNFGQHYAISAGLERARGKWVIVMDCDLQDQPSEIPKLLAKAKAGFDVVLARRVQRQDCWFKRVGSRAFYKVLSYLTETKQDPSVANFGVYSHKAVAAINTMSETIRYFPTMVRWVGFRSTSVSVEHAARPDGTTTYNLRKLLNLALDICLAYSDKPLRLVVKTGFVVSAIGFVFAAFTLVKAFRGEIEVLGYASLIISMWALSGLIIVIVGVVGLYVGKTFEGVKRRPAFVVAEELNGSTQYDGE